MQTQHQDPDIRPQYYTTADIQVIMGCCADTARTYARQHLAKGQGIRQGRAILVPRVIFDDWRKQRDGTAAYYKVPFKVIEGGKSPTGDTATKQRAEIERLRAELDRLTAPKKRGRPRKNIAQRT